MTEGDFNDCILRWYYICSPWNARSRPKDDQQLVIIPADNVPAYISHSRAGQYKEAHTRHLMGARWRRALSLSFHRLVTDVQKTSRQIHSMLRARARDYCSPNILLTLGARAQTEFKILLCFIFLLKFFKPIILINNTRKVCNIFCILYYTAEKSNSNLKLPLCHERSGNPFCREEHEYIFKSCNFLSRFLICVRRPWLRKTRMNIVYFHFEPHDARRP